MGPVRIAIDAEGGDQGIPVIVQGVIDARRMLGDVFTVVLCGREDRIMAELVKQGGDASDGWLGIRHCPELTDTAQQPSQVWRRHPDSSIVQCVALQRDGVVDASVCAGDTGVLMATAVFLLGKQKDALRPALAATVPTAGGNPALLLDVGANIHCRAEHLVSFAGLGSGYMKRFYQASRPKVALLNIGEEHFKGTQAIMDAHEMLKAGFPGYSGFIEGSRVLSGDADVIVCEGFAGNVMLKICESFYALTGTVLAGDPELLSTITRRMAILNADNYGAVPLLGIHGVVLKAHGRSSATAIAHAVGTTVTVVKRGAVPLDGAGNPEKRQQSHVR